MALLDEWGVALAVLGLLLATLFLASVLSRYQAHQATLRSTIRRIEGGLMRTTHALARLGAVPLSRELRVTLRNDILARCQRIRRLYRGYPDIDRLIREAEQALKAEGGTVEAAVGPIENEQAFRILNQAMKDLIAVIDERDTLQPIPRDVCAIFRRELGERHAEVMARFHLVAARDHENNDDLARARAHLSTLLQLLRRRSPATPFVRELIAETEAAQARLGRAAGPRGGSLTGISAETGAVRVVS